MSRERATPILLFAGALALNLGLLALYYWPEPRALAGHENYYVGIAQSLAAGPPRGRAPQRFRPRSRPARRFRLK